MNRVLAGRAVTPGVLPSSESIRLSKWVNELYLPWAEILTAHDVARLTRRYRWMLVPPLRRSAMRNGGPTNDYPSAPYRDDSQSKSDHSRERGIFRLTLRRRVATAVGRLRCSSVPNT